MKTTPKVLDDERSVTVRVPISIRRRGGRKLVLTPGGGALTAAPVHRRIDTGIVKAVARAFRWRELLESGEYSTIREIAAAEKINDSYVSRVLRLSLLAPDIVECILDHRFQGLQLLLAPFPINWEEQRHLFLLDSVTSVAYALSLAQAGREKRNGLRQEPIPVFLPSHGGSIDS